MRPRGQSFSLLSLVAGNEQIATLPLDEVDDVGWIESTEPSEADEGQLAAIDQSTDGAFVNGHRDAATPVVELS